MTKRIGIAAVFFVGCAVGGASSQLMVPRARAEQDAVVARWEYKCVGTPDHGVMEVSNRLGAEGWEMTTVRARVVLDGGDLYCFKRPKM
jgi:hypothetical protein